MGFEGLLWTQEDICGSHGVFQREREEGGGETPSLHRLKS